MKKLRLSSVVIVVLFLVSISSFVVTAKVNNTVDFTLKIPNDSSYSWVSKEYAQKKDPGYTKAGVNITDSDGTSGICYANIYNYTEGTYIANAYAFDSGRLGTFYISYQSYWIEFQPNDLRLAMRSNSLKTITVSGSWTANGEH